MNHIRVVDGKTLGRTLVTQTVKDYTRSSVFKDYTTSDRTLTTVTRFQREEEEDIEEVEREEEEDIEEVVDDE